jgi:cellobiose phosphorylase
VQHHAWDGEWYCRTFYDDGTAIGSRNSDECQIDLIAQAWSVLARGDEPERTTRAMESAFARLVEPEQRLIKLLQPPFDRGARNPGYIKGYPPGIRENGGQYTHAAVWGVWAWAELGQIERVGRLWRDLLPPNHAQSLTDVERYRVEPYVAAADIYSAAPWAGRGGWTWYTGSAAWLYRLGVERLLGLVKRGDRLELAPALPPEWTHCQAELRHGQARYRIRFDAPSGGTRVTSVHLDGIAQKGTSIKLDRGPGVHEVVVGVASAPVAGTSGPPGG